MANYVSCFFICTSVMKRDRMKFHHNLYINSLTTHHWDTDISQVIHQMQLHRQYVSWYIMCYEYWKIFLWQFRILCEQNCGTFTWRINLTGERWHGGYFDPTRIHFAAVGIFLGIITRQFTYLLLHSSPYLRCHWHFLRTAGIRDNGINV